MALNESTGQERREFFRINFKTPLEFKSYAHDLQDQPKASDQAVSRNISQSGILFQIEKNPPKLSSILWMNLDFRTLKICQEIERRALIFNNGLVGRVVRVEENPQEEDVFDVGVCFLTQEQEKNADVQKILAKIGN